MPSTAISAQGTTFAVAGTPGSAINITGVTKSSTGAVVSTSNPPPVGTSVVFGTIAGMPELTGRYGIVLSVVAGTSFVVNIDSSGFGAAGTGGTATPQTFITIANVHDYTGFDGVSAEIDVTNLSSLAKEYSPGLEDFGQFSLNLDVNGADPGQVALRAAKTGQQKTYFLLTARNGAQRLIFGFVKKFSESGSVDGVLKGSVDIRISSRPSFSEITN